MIDDLSSHSGTKPPMRGLRFSLRQVFIWMLCVCIVLAILVAFSNLVRTARQAALTSGSESSLNQLQNGLRNYHSVHGHFPPAFIADEQGKPVHSWRILILPYIEEKALYDKYDFTEPWDGPNNSKLANKMPRVFQMASEKPSTTFTNIVAITGPGTAFPGAGTTTLADFTDGPENTILLTEITNSKIPWLAPRDIDTQHCPLAVNARVGVSISSVHWRRPFVVFADRLKGYAMDEDIPPETLKALSTIAGGEPVTRSQLIRDGLLK